MKSIREFVEISIEKAFEEAEIDKKFAKAVKSQRPDLCQFQCNGALAAAKILGENPRNIGQKIIGVLSKNTDFAKVEIAGAGFINITLKDDIIAKIISQRNYNNHNSPQTIILDFGGPNVAKPMHVGHLRSAIIGDCLRRLFKYLGCKVIADNHLGDWGTQMGMLICKTKEKYPSLPYFDEDFFGEYPKNPPFDISQLELLYPQASKECKENPQKLEAAVKATDELQRGKKGFVALWKHFVDLSVETLKRDFSKLGVEFDYWLGESFYADKMKEIVEYLKKENFVKESQGALVLDVAESTDTKEIPPVLLVKSGGGFLYATSDIATIDYRVKEFSPNRICYIVDKRQSLHFEQVFRAVKKTKIAPPELFLQHVGFGTVNGTDGKPYKTREGGVMKLSDLIDLVVNKAKERLEEAGLAVDESENEKIKIAETVGISALKFADLSNYRLSDYIFDLDKFCAFEGKTGPYLLYTAVRIKSIIRKAKEANITSGAILIGDNDRDLLLEIGRMNEALELAAADCSPNFLCDYVYGLSQEFNRFYKNSPILHEKNIGLQSSRLKIAEITLETIEIVLEILGINIPEKM
ncbi:MAG: arginine--tRNA ligase [Chitinispirillales bacterium]|nr:arginine--tRNA ligase [Chitinispirillales bacterium]